VRRRRAVLDEVQLRGQQASLAHRRFLLQAALLKALEMKDRDTAADLVARSKQVEAQWRQVSAELADARARLRKENAA
jgi:hypothetical protein